MYSVNTLLTESMVNADRSHAGQVVGRLVRVGLVTGANIGLAIIVTAIVLLLLLALFLSAHRKTAQPSGARPRSSGATPRRAGSQQVSQAAPAAVDTHSSESRVPNETASVVEGAPAMSDTGGMETWADAPGANGHDSLVAVGSLPPTDALVADERESLPVSSTAAQENFSWSMPEEWSTGTPSSPSLTGLHGGAGQQVAADQRPDAFPQHVADPSQLDRMPANVLVVGGNEYAGGEDGETMSKSVAARRESRGRSASRAAKLSAPEITVSAVQETPNQVVTDNNKRNDESRSALDVQPEGTARQPNEQQPDADLPTPRNEAHARVDDALHMARLLDETLRDLAQEMDTAESQKRVLNDRLQSMEQSFQTQVAFRDSLLQQVSAATSDDDLTGMQQLVTAVVENPNNLMVLLKLYEQSQRLATVVQEYADLRRLVQSG